MADIEKQLKELIAKKDSMEVKLMGLETEIKAIDDSKHFQKGTVDAEGFPRADVDFGELSNYRNLKRQKAMLNNDHLALMKQIQKLMFALHQSFPDIAQEQQEVTTQKSEQKFSEMKEEEIEAGNKFQQHKIDYLTPFAKVSLVQEESPAQKGGLKVGDLVSEFSSVNIYSIDTIKQIPKFVKEGQVISVVILRGVAQDTEGEDVFTLKDGHKYRKIVCKVTPEKWAGKGLLGCKIDPWN